MKMYELVEEFQWLQDRLEEAEDVEVREAIADTLESMEITLEDKFEYLVKLSKNYQATVDAIKAEKKALTEKQQALENRVEGLKHFMQETMEKLGYKNVQAGVWKVAIQKNPASLDWDATKDWKIVPEDFRTPQPDKVDSRALLNFIKEQEDQEYLGIKLKQGESIRIR